MFTMKWGRAGEGIMMGGAQLAAGKAKVANRSSVGGYVLWSLVWAAGIALLIAKFAVDNDWDLVAEISAAVSQGSTTRLDWGNWIEVGLIALGCVGGGAAVSGVPYLAKKISNSFNINISGIQFGNRATTYKNKTVKGFSREALKELENAIAKLPTELGDLLRSAIEQTQRSNALPLVKLPLEDYEKAETLVNETLKNKELQRRVRWLQKKRRQLSGQASNFEARISDLDTEVGAERQRCIELRIQLEATEQKLRESYELLGRAAGLLNRTYAIGNEANEFSEAVARLTSDQAANA